ncbi:P-loop containing nucleoside triphosphate hydrolase protein [Coprinellus micaceus]|uniref:P-loop containing nucleoside triphosphate hydrolase protein n=1 Tax=Coprinellus micaceus TaxID=71717 RepID=A0A4Y7S7J1_COPMI|nr:P-loop containing nucleoside triphosphate hydrolase protein [Coprinellus micaceus]
MSGKSTYLRQLGLLTVMAMIGCFVPAEYASFKLFDALLTRLSNDDDLERGLSTFANEMTKVTDPHGDESAGGVGISHAIAEALISAKPCVFFATHFEELSMTLSRHPSVVNLHLSVQRTAQTATNFGMVFRYKCVDAIIPWDEFGLTVDRILDGVSEHTFHYGLFGACASSRPPPPTSFKRAAVWPRKLAELQKKQEEESEGSQIALRRKVLLRLKQVLNHSTLPDEDLLEYLKEVQRGHCQCVL